MGWAAPTVVPRLWELLLFPLAPDSLHLLSLIIWVPLLCPLPPHDGLIPVTSTEAPVMYPLSSDAKNVTASATSMRMVVVGRGWNPTHSHRSKVITSHQNPSPPTHTLPTTNPSEVLSDTTNFGISSFGAPP